MALAALLATLGLDAGRVHLIDAFPRDRPTNFLCALAAPSTAMYISARARLTRTALVLMSLCLCSFRSNNPVNQSSDSAIFDLAYVTGERHCQWSSK